MAMLLAIHWNGHMILETSIVHANPTSFWSPWTFSNQKRDHEPTEKSSVKLTSFLISYNIPLFLKKKPIKKKHLQSGPLPYQFQVKKKT